MPPPWETAGKMVPQKQEQPPSQAGGPLSWMNALGQGLSFGTSDEAASALRASMTAPLSDRTWADIYREELANQREMLAAGRKEHPILSTLAEMGGAAATGMKLGGAANAVAPEMLARIPALARLAGVGALEGAAYGAGAANEGDRLAGAVQGGIVGGVAAPVAAGAIKAGAALSRKLLAPVARMALNSPRTQAVRNVIQALEADDIMPHEAVQRLQELGPDAVIADIGPNMQATARATAGQTSRARSIASGFLRERQSGQIGRLTKGLIDIDPRDFRRGFLKFVTNRKTASEPLYRQAFEMPLDTSGKLQTLLDRPAMRRAMSRAARNMLDEGGGYSHLRLIDQAKQVIDDDIGQAIRNGRRNQARILTRLKNELLDEIDTRLGGGNPENSIYRQARQLFAGEAQLKDAALLGRNALRPSTDLDAIEMSLEAMSASEKDAFRSGVVRSLLDVIEGSRVNSNTAQKVIKSPRMQQALRLAFNSDDAFERFVSSAEAESVFSQTRNIVEGGSRTAEFLRGMQEIDKGASMLRAATTGGNDPISTGINTLKALGFGDASPETLEEMAKMLFSRGPGLKVIQREAQRAARSAVPAIAREAGTAAGAVAGVEAVNASQ